MKNTISHISRQERRKIERKVARMSPQELNKYGAEKVGMSERDFFKMTWCASMERNVATAIALLGYFEENRQEMGARGLKKFAQLGLFLPIFGEFSNFQSGLDRHSQGSSSHLMAMIQEGYFKLQTFKPSDRSSPLSQWVSNAARTMRPDQAQKNDFALFVTDKIEVLFPVMNGKKSVEDLWNNYVKTDPFTRLGIPV